MVSVEPQIVILIIINVYSGFCCISILKFSAPSFNLIGLDVFLFSECLDLLFKASLIISNFIYLLTRVGP